MISTADLQGLKPLASAIPQVTAEWSKGDLLNALKVRWGFGRNNSKVAPGLYKIGAPNKESDVFVSANYRLSFDVLRRHLAGFDAWIMVLDTKGVNVWCAAGKGTFGTETLVKSIRETALASIVSHRRLIVPQLGAVGVAAHKVKEQTGFRVVYGPVRAADIAEFVKAGYKATPEMRRVFFPLAERAKLVPVDLVQGRYKLLGVLLAFFVLSGLDRTGFLFSKMVQSFWFPAANVLTGYIAGLVFTPLLLPFIPGRAFALKGAIVGLLSVATLNFLFDEPILVRVALGLFAIAIASFSAMNFTGSSTYTSLSGVKLEMKWAIPFQIAFAVTGLLLFILLKLM